MKGKAKGWGRKTRLLLAALALSAAAVVIVSTILGLRGRDLLRLDEAVTAGINGQMFSWPAGTRLMHKDGVTLLREESGWSNLESCPLMYPESGGFLLQKSMIWTRTEEDKVLRLDYYSQVQEGEQGVSLLARGGARADGADGFLYDGVDTYLFLEEAELSWEGGDDIKIMPLTVVQVVYRNYINLYGPNTEPFFSYLTGDEVIARFPDKKRIDLATDRYFMPNGAWRLLFMPMEQLNTIK